MPLDPDKFRSKPWIKVGKNYRIMSFSIYLDHADVVNELFGVVGEEEWVESDRADLVAAASIGCDPTVTAIAV